MRKIRSSKKTWDAGGPAGSGFVLSAGGDGIEATRREASGGARESAIIFRY